MVMQQISLATTIILLFPLGFFLLSSLTFLLARLQDPVVTWMLRGLFSVCFLGASLTAAMAALAFVGAARPAVAIGLALLAAVAFQARRLFLRGLDQQILARDGGDGLAVSRLRRLHVGGMLVNATQFVAVVASIPHVFPGAL